MSKQAAELVAVEPWHIRYVKDHMRKADRLELEAVRGWTAEEELDHAIHSTEHARACVYYGKVLAIFGDTKHDRYFGLPWMVSTDAIVQHPRPFLAECRGVIEDMRSRHLFLLNFADSRNTLAIRWLKWLGFTFENPAPYGAKGIPFHAFHMEGTACVQ